MTYSILHFSDPSATRGVPVLDGSSSESSASESLLEALSFLFFEPAGRPRFAGVVAVAVLVFFFEVGAMKGIGNCGV